MRFRKYMNESWSISDYDRKSAEKFKSYHHKELKKFKKDIEQYDIPEDYRNWTYSIALEQLDDYFKGKLSHIDIFYNPDNELRNVMKIWPIDKKKMKRRKGK